MHYTDEEVSRREGAQYLVNCSWYGLPSFFIMELIGALVGGQYSDNTCWDIGSCC